MAEIGCLQQWQHKVSMTDTDMLDYPMVINEEYMIIELVDFIGLIDSMESVDSVSRDSLDNSICVIPLNW